MLEMDTLPLRLCSGAGLPLKWHNGRRPSWLMALLSCLDYCFNMAPHTFASGHAYDAAGAA